MTRRVLQICPHDSAPFGALCERYEHAAALAGIEIVTVFLGPPTGAALGFARYLDLDDLTSATHTRAGLAPYLDENWQCVLCHRYRAFWAVRVSGGELGRCIVLAHEYGLLDRWQRRLGRVWYGRRVRYAGVTPAVAAELAAVAGSALVLPNVLDVEATRAELLPQHEALQLLELEPGPATFGVVGRLHYKKRPALAMDAFRHWSARDQRAARLVFVGSGELRDELAGQAADHIVFCGAVPGAARAFAAFDVLLHTASAEPFGMVVLEAMIAGVPVVARPGHGPEYVLGDLGFYAVEDTPTGYAEAMSRALAADRGALAERGLARAQRCFSLQALADELDRVIDQQPSG